MKLLIKIFVFIFIGLVFLYLLNNGKLAIFDIDIDDVYILAGIVVVLAFYFEYKYHNLKCAYWNLYEANNTLLNMHSKLFDDVSILRGDINEKINHHTDIVNMQSHQIANLQAKVNDYEDAINKLARHTEYPKSNII